MIPEVAVVAASKALMADKMSNHSGDNAPQIMDACEKVARKVLEAAAPHMLAEAWDQAIEAAAMRSHDINCAEIAGESPPGGLINNPYRVTK